jgi:hypothetical protein
VDDLLSYLPEVFVVAGSLAALYWADVLAKGDIRVRDRIVYLICLGGLVGWCAALSFP